MHLSENNISTPHSVKTQITIICKISEHFIPAQCKNPDKNYLKIKEHFNPAQCQNTDNNYLQNIRTFQPRTVSKHKNNYLENNHPRNLKLS
jgi:hypothetical protein